MRSRSMKSLKNVKSGSTFTVASLCIEQPEAPVDVASEGGQIEDGEKVKAIPSKKPRNDGHLLSDYEKVEMDNQLVSIDPTTEGM